MNQEFLELLNRIEGKQPGEWNIEVGGQTYTRQFQMPDRLVLLGGGHVSKALGALAASLDFDVTVVDDRPEFVTKQRFPDAKELLCEDYQQALQRMELTDRDYVAIVTRGHRYDLECLQVLLKGTAPKYIGMIGSRGRVASLFRQLEEQGYDKSRIAEIHAPIGLAINAQTPQEIAVAIAAEIIQCRRANQPRRSKSKILLNKDVDLALLRYLAEDPQPKALAVVYETSGSTPAKSGAMMVVNRDFQARGTIGGGCWENQTMLEAYRMVGTGGKKCISVELDDDDAEDEGMACGGKMQIFICDLPQNGADAVETGEKI